MTSFRTAATTATVAGVVWVAVVADGSPRHCHRFPPRSAGRRRPHLAHLRRLTVCAVIERPHVSALTAATTDRADLPADVTVTMSPSSKTEPPAPPPPPPAPVTGLVATTCPPATALAIDRDDAGIVS